MPVLEQDSWKAGGLLRSDLPNAKRQRGKWASATDVYSSGHAEDIRATHRVPRSATFPDRRDLCGNPACSRGWLSFLKDRRRPVFEGRWGCTAKCVERLVEAAIRRESSDRDDSQDGSEHRHRVPLGLILLAQGWITHPQLRHALDMQRRAGKGRIGQWLIEECGLEEGRVTHALGVQWRCPVLSLDGFDPEAMALAVPKALVESVGIVPLRVAGGRILYLGFEDRLDDSIAFAMKRMCGHHVESGLMGGEQWRAAKAILCECDFVDSTFEQVRNIEEMSRKVAFSVGKAQPRASRFVRVHEFYWLRMWLESGAMSTCHGGIPATKEDVVDRLYTVGLEQ